MSKTVISVEHLSKQYDLGVIGSGTISRDLTRWWAWVRGKEDPYAKIGEKDAATLREDVELIDGVYGELAANDYLTGKVAPVFFGSALYNFGVQELLDAFVKIAPSSITVF